MSESKNVTVNTVGLGTLLGVLFIGLKLTGYITWSWLWVLSPFWLGPVIGIGFTLIVVAIVAIGAFLAG